MSNTRNVMKQSRREKKQSAGMYAIISTGVSATHTWINVDFSIYLPEKRFASNSTQPTTPTPPTVELKASPITKKIVSVKRITPTQSANKSPLKGEFHFKQAPLGRDAFDSIRPVKRSLALIFQTQHARVALRFIIDQTRVKLSLSLRQHRV